MFNLLSSEKSLLELANRYKGDDLKVVSANLKRILELLNTPASELLHNRKTHGVLLPQADINKGTVDVNIQTLLLEQDELIQAVNTLNLTEATFVRNNVSECLTLILDENSDIDMLVPEYKPVTKKIPKANVKSVEVDVNVAKNIEPEIENIRSNVAPIRLNEVKQRLAQAVKAQDTKKDAIKNRLNNLLTKTENSDSVISTKLA